MSTAAMAAIFHTPETAAQAAKQMSGLNYTVNLSSGNYVNPYKSYTSYVNPYTTYQPHWTVNPTWTGEYVNPIPWNDQPYHQPYTQPYNTDVWPAEQAQVYVNCPHCGRNVPQKGDWTCTNCKRSLFVFTPAQPAQINWPLQLPAVPPAAPTLPRKETLPPPTPEPKDSHAGDGSRWDDI